ncbi:hypothetical protein FRB99_006694 [Tulasnella sp. 403]|nr:hypothetical protein FRB99_006694 [Tulasnella sp. 403]
MPGPEPQPDVTAKFGPPVLERVQNSSILDTLVPDLWVEIFKNLTVIEILRTRQTCQALRNVTSLRSVWFNAIKNLIENENLSIPRLTLPLNTYSTDVLESLAVRTVQLSLNLSAPVPRLVSWVSWSVCSDVVRNLYITQVLFVSGMDNSKWILTVYGGRSIACWEILSDPLVVLPAGGWDSQQILIDVSVNKVKSHEATFAVTTEHHGTYRGLIMGWEHMRSGEIPTVTTLATLVFPPGRLRLLEGDLVYFYRKRRGGICTAVNWRTKAQHCFPVHPIDMPNPPHSNLTPVSLLLIDFAEQLIKDPFELDRNVSLYTHKGANSSL